MAATRAMKSYLMTPTMLNLHWRICPYVVSSHKSKSSTDSLIHLHPISVWNSTENMLVLGHDVIVSYCRNVSQIASSGPRSIVVHGSESETILAFSWCARAADAQSTLPIPQEIGFVLVWVIHQFGCYGFSRVSSTACCYTMRMTQVYK